MSPVARRSITRLPRERRIEDIIVAARRVFEQRGFADAAIADIAAAANVVEGTIYRYFDSKRELFVRVIEGWYAEMLADFDGHLRKLTAPRDRLRYLIWRHLWTIYRNPVLSRFVFNELRPHRDYRSTTVFQLNREYTRRTMDVLREGIAAGELRSDVPLSLVRAMIYGTAEHYTWKYLRGEGDFAVESTADAITDLVWRALATPRAAKEPAADATAPDAVARIEAVADRLERVSKTLRVVSSSPRARGRKTRS
jgi:TetR/AcrR family transcriptional regulator, fatty acid metabolism regulator protein